MFLPDTGARTPNPALQTAPGSSRRGARNRGGTRGGSPSTPPPADRSQRKGFMYRKYYPPIKRAVAPGAAGNRDQSPSSSAELPYLYVGKFFRRLLLSFGGDIPVRNLLWIHFGGSRQRMPKCYLFQKT